MASAYKLESKEDRVERFKQVNPDRPLELCEEVINETWKQRRKMIHEMIPPRFKDADMKDLGHKAASIINVLDSIFFPKDFNNSPVGMIFCGPVGSGKTHAAYAPVKYLTEINPEIVIYMDNYPSVIQALRREFVENSYDELGSSWDKLNNESGLYGGLIFLDDVSAHKQSDFEEDRLLAFLSRRVDNHMPFILTTNESAPVTKMAT